jgi:protein-S-isoprenylcysteine O-methyltransferase Ste14
MWRQVRAILLLPGVVALLIPAVILWFAQADSLEWPWPLDLLAVITGLVFIGLGFRLMAQTIRLFAAAGQGTLAPWDPTHKLVVQGIYRRVRNPMITGVGCVLLGEALLFRSLSLFYWFIAFAILNVAYIPLLEEPGLVKRFGDDYLLYKENVPRWVPRRHAWQPPWEQ